MKRILFSTLPATLLLLACPPQQQGEVVPSAQEPGQQQAAVKADEAMPVAAHATPKVEHDCAEGTTELSDDKVVTRQNEKGETITHAGADFADGAVVSVSELLAKPDDFAGKKVRIKGNISAMCHHRRGWFAVVADDQSGRFVRVMTAPAFLVPPGSIGKTADAEGVVEVIEVAAEHAKHIAGEHKLGDPEAITANIKQVVVRASGADFI
ncbi:MAG: hypothetical protein ABIJ09_22010 [Pseudomonadota bacterium]